MKGISSLKYLRTRARTTDLDVPQTPDWAKLWVDPNPGISELAIDVEVVCGGGDC